MFFKIAAIPGDGIGPELIEQAILVLEKIGKNFGHSFSFEKIQAGGCAIDAFGEALPGKTLDVCRQSDAVLLGAIGGPKWDHLEGSQRPEKALLKLRKELGLYANIRPAVLHEALRDACPLRPELTKAGIDLCVVRELTGGIYFGEQGKKEDKSGTVAYDTETYSDWEIKRIALTAFKIAVKRLKKVTSIDKANILESSRLWRSVVIEVAKNFPEVELNHMYVDNAAMQLIRDPGQFDVILTSNMFGDILSDEAAMITGSIGMLPSASLGDRKRGMYEPVHGSAPDLEGQDKANPIATILSTAMMLRHSFNREEEANAIEHAVAKVLGRDYRTADIMSLGKNLVGTKEMGGLICEAIDENGELVEKKEI